ncbi:MAG: hypothetical protein LBM39_01505 [Candidatus Methanoplasma sp.]|jgi:hypothetical protein|nr:hypothetical protein [Candidatus Methanoplasma sp.]
MIGKMSRDGSGIATIIVLLVVVIVIVGAGAVAFIAISGSGSDEPEEKTVIAGPCISSLYVYKAEDGSTIGAEVVGNSNGLTVFNIRLKSYDGDTFLVVDKATGKLNVNADCTTDGSEDDPVRTWDIILGGTSAEVSTKKIDGAYVISDLKISDKTYVFDPETSKVIITSDEASEKVGEIYEYSYEIYYNTTAGFKTTTEGKITITRLADAVNGKYIITVKKEITWPDDFPDSVKTRFDDTSSLEYYVTESAGYELFGETLKNLDRLDSEYTPGTSNGEDTRIYSHISYYNMSSVTLTLNMLLEVSSPNDILYRYSLNETTTVLSSTTANGVSIKLIKHTD